MINLDKILKNRTAIMGILNVTPDSFSDGGENILPEKAVNKIKEMIKNGVDIIDVGGQSTRPGYTCVSAEDELTRILPVLEIIFSFDIIVSVDTFYPFVAKKALELGAHIINDVTGLDDGEMIKLIAKSNAKAVITHHEGGDITEVTSFLNQRADKAVLNGISEKNIILDGGIGFLKSYEEDISIIKNYGQIAKLGYPLIIGASRKRVIGLSSQTDNKKDRLYGTIAAHTIAQAQGANILRVHDVKEAKQAALTSDKILFGREDNIGTNHY